MIVIFLLFGILSYPHYLTLAQNNFIYTSYWYGGVTEIQQAKSQTIDIKQCIKDLGFAPQFLQPGLTLLSKISDMAIERQRLTNLNLKYAIGEKNKLLELFGTIGTTITKIESMYPTDKEVMDVVVKVFTTLVNNTNLMQNILIIVNRTQDYNNMEINNYENIVKSINAQNWSNVKFIEYTNPDDIIYIIRQQNYFNIISLLYDPNVNQVLMQRAFLAHLMVWKYRWIILDLLGGENVLGNQDLFGKGVVTNNITIITFARNDLSGRLVLLQSAFQIIISNVCNENPSQVETLSGNFNLFKRQFYQFAIYQNPGSQRVFIGNVTYFSDSSSMILPAQLKAVDYQLNEIQSVLNLNLTGLKVGFIEYPPFSYTNGSTMVGFTIDLINYLLKDFNITPTIVPLPVKDIGSFYFSNLSFSGALGLLQNGTIDTISVPLIITNNRLDYFDFATPVLTGSISGLYKDPKLIGLAALANYIQPFHWTVWITLLSSSLAITISLAITDFLFPDKFSRYRFLMSLFFSLSSLTHGAYFDPPRKVGGRILMSFWWLFCLFVVIIWISNYAALLAKQNKQQKLSAFTDILNQNAFNYTTINDYVVFEYLNNNPYQNPQIALRLMKDEFPNGTVNSINDALNLVTSTANIFLYDDKTLSYYRYNRCLTMFGKFAGFSYGLVLPKNSEKTVILTNKLIGRFAQGNISLFYEKHAPSFNPLCKSTDVVDIIAAWLDNLYKDNFIGALGINTMIGVFVITVVGSVCTLILAVFEKLIRLLVMKSKQHREKYESANTMQQLTTF